MNYQGGYVENSASEDFDNKAIVEFGNGSSQESPASNRINLSPENSPQDEQCLPLGLKLTISPDFLNLIEMTLSRGKQVCSADENRGISMEKKENLGPRQRNQDQFQTQNLSDRFKASNFPGELLQIGQWEWHTQREGDLVAKIYYAKKKMVWEILYQRLKKKIEIQWSDIEAIRADMPDDQPATLELMLNQPPLFYDEINPQPRKHTQWEQAADFTHGHAPVFRKHTVKFRPGVLDKHYEKLMQFDPRLLALSNRPFPSNQSPYFPHQPAFASPGITLNWNGYRSTLSPEMQHPNSASNANVATLPVRINSKSRISDLPQGIERSQTHPFQAQHQTVWCDGVNSIDRNNIPNPRPVTPVYQPFCQSEAYQGHEMVFNGSTEIIWQDNMQNHMPAGTRIVSSNEGNLAAIQQLQLNPNDASVARFSEMAYQDIEDDGVIYNESMLDDFNQNYVSLPSHESSNRSLEMEPSMSNAISPYSSLNTGNVVHVMGQEVDVAFPPGKIPNIHNALIVRGKSTSGELLDVTFHVIRILGNNQVRARAIRNIDCSMEILQVIDTGEPLVSYLASYEQQR